MQYKIADLDYIYVRVGHTDKTINELSDNEFIDWAEKKFGIKIKDEAPINGVPWTPRDRVAFLNDISKKLGQPAVTMVRRERRDEWDKGKRHEQESSATS